MESGVVGMDVGIIVQECVIIPQVIEIILHPLLSKRIRIRCSSQVARRKWTHETRAHLKDPERVLEIKEVLLPTRVSITQREVAPIDCTRQVDDQDYLGRITQGRNSDDCIDQEPHRIERLQGVEWRIHSLTRINDNHQTRDRADLISTTGWVQRDKKLELRHQLLRTYWRSRTRRTQRAISESRTYQVSSSTLPK